MTRRRADVARKVWAWVDPVVAVALGLFILPRTVALGRDALRILLQAAPRHLDPETVRAGPAGLDGVRDVHDLHVWTLTEVPPVVVARWIADSSVSRRVVRRARRSSR